MSNALAIAAVTTTLRNLLDAPIKAEVSGATVTLQLPEIGVTPTNRVNLFLYQTSIDAHWRNMDMPRQVQPGEIGRPPLALNLQYLLTAFGANDDDPGAPVSHRLLGRAMSVFHDHPVLSGDDIRGALTNAERDAHDLYDQIEHVRITPLPLSLDDLSKLWTAFSRPYRISTAYQAAVVLIESRRPSRAALPVLRRGPGDRGVDAQSGLIAPFPTLTGIALPAPQQPSARIGDTITIRGHHLDGIGATVRFTHPRLQSPIDVPVAAIATSEETEVAVALNDPALLAGYVTVSMIISRNDPANPTRTTNELSFALAPTFVISSITPHTIALTSNPPVLPAQRAALLLGDREIIADARDLNDFTALSFTIPSVAAGDYFVRLRVDGVDSLLIDYQQTPLQFDPNQKVTIP